MKKNQLIKTILLLISFMLSQSAVVLAQCAKFEPPPGKALMILGQDLDAVGGLTNYKNGYIETVVGTDNTIFPAGVTTYTDLTYNLGLYNETNYGAGPLRAQAYPEDGDFANSVISIGLDLQSGQLDATANGQMDGNINTLVNWINAQNPRPVFLRIGYEFNAVHNKYNGSTFITAWKRIVDKFRAANVSNVAFVWQADDSQGSESAINAWYPGDSYVDWVGYSRFLGNGGGMISFARNHKKPCMIAEATPMGHKTASEDGNTLWNNWYAPMFQQVRDNNDVIKAVCYINQNWDAQPIWQNTFGDSRIQANAILKTKWLAEIKTSLWLHASATLFSNLKTGCSGGVNADFTTNAVRLYSGQSITFTNRSSGNITGYSWDFGAGASPATSTSVGPVKVTYSTAGLKTVTLTVTGPGGLTNTITKTSYVNVEPVPTSSCMHVDDFTSATTVSKFASPPNAFTHAQSGSDWVITSAKGHDEWDFWKYTFNDGSVARSLNFSHPTLTKPVVTFKAKKKAASGTANFNAILKVDMYDAVSATDGSFKNTIVLTDSYQTFTVDFTKQFLNKYGCGFAGCGIVDSVNIVGLQFAVNPGFASYPITVGSTKFNSYFVGDIDIEIISVGNGCDGVVLSDFSANKFSVDANEQVTFSSTSSGTITGYSWNFGAGASPATATTAGPHTVTYSTYGLKAVSLTVTGSNGSDTKTKTDYINVAVKTTTCGLFSDQFNDAKVSTFVTGPSFTYAETSGAMTITSVGHDQWDKIDVAANDGAIASPVDMTSNKKLYIKIKASKAMGLRISLMDANDNEAGNDGMTGKTDKTISTEWQTFAIDYTGLLSGTWYGKGSLDASKISKITLRANPGYTCCPIGAFNTAFTGTIYVDWVILGDSTGCAGGIITGIENPTENTSYQIHPNPFVNEAALIINGNNNESAHVIIRDLSGREVYNQNLKIQDNKVFIGRDLQIGLYLVQVVQNNRVQTMKIIKQ